MTPIDPHPTRRRRPRPALPAALAMLLMAGCTDYMIDQDKLETQEASSFFRDGKGSRPQVTGTVARGELRLDPAKFDGKVDGRDVVDFPMPVTEAVVQRGQERFRIYCTPCHGGLGDGDGMIVRRGMPRPPSFHEQRLRNEPAGHFYSVITNGHGVMYSYASRINPDDRWAVVAYIRALQLSQNATVADLKEIPSPGPETQKLLKEAVQ